MNAIRNPEFETLAPGALAALEDIVRIQAAGGTTGRPMRIAMARHDSAD